MTWRQYGAVRSPLGRLIPKAAHSRSESVCSESARLEYSRVECLAFKAAISAKPPSVLGGGNCRDERRSVLPRDDSAVSATARGPVAVSRRVAMLRTPRTARSEMCSEHAPAHGPRSLYWYVHAIR